MTLINRLLYTLLGILITSYIIYIRIIATRIPKELYIFEPMQYKIIPIIFTGIMIAIYMIYKNIKIIKNRMIINNVMQKIMTKITTIIDNSLEELYRFIAELFTKNYEIVSAICKYFYKVFGLRNENILLLVSITIRFIILIVFIIDVFIYFRLDYFYKSLFLLCIPLIINIVIYILRDFSNNLNDIKSYLIINEGIDSSFIASPFPWLRLPLRFYASPKAFARDARFVKEWAQNFRQVILFMVRNNLMVLMWLKDN